MKARLTRLLIQWISSLSLIYSTTIYAQEQEMKITLKTNYGKTLTATINSSETAKEFLNLLPLTLTLEDYNKTEKISDLPKKLTREGAPTAITPKTGDIAYYAPWGNLAIFYRNFSYSPGLIKLGVIDSALEALTTPGPIQVTIEIQR